MLPGLPPGVGVGGGGRRGSPVLARQFRGVKDGSLVLSQTRLVWDCHVGLPRNGRSGWLTGGQLIGSPMECLGLYALYLDPPCQVSAMVALDLKVTGGDLIRIGVLLFCTTKHGLATCGSPATGVYGEGSEICGGTAGIPVTWLILRCFLEWIQDWRSKVGPE